MRYPEIDAYLQEFGVNTSKPRRRLVNSKWVYTKELLAGEPDRTVLAIAAELDIEHPFGTVSGHDLQDSPFWQPGHFRVFISHLARDKKKASALQRSLRNFGITSFVAHEDIQPSREWQKEIEKALLTMDALVALLTPGFHESLWTDQEVGAALGRERLIIPIRAGSDPYGFIGKYQGLQAVGARASAVAEKIFAILRANRLSRDKIAEVVVGLFQAAREEAEMLHWLRLLDSFERVPAHLLQNLSTNIPKNKVIVRFSDVVSKLNELLARHDAEPMVMNPQTEDVFDMPF